MIILSLGQMLILFLSTFNKLNPTIIPGYWNPDTLFNLGRITKGLSIEDMIFMVFAGGVATCIYEFIYGKKIKVKRTRKQHIIAPLIGAIAAGIFMQLFRPNPIYPLILFGFVGALVLWIQRKDLIKHSLIGGLGFVIIYLIGFTIFNLIFPDFISNVYNLKSLSGIIIFNIPIEEYLYAFSFGLLWAPLYEYEHGEVNVNIKKQK